MEIRDRRVFFNRFPELAHSTYAAYDFCDDVQPAYLLPKPPPTPLHAMIRFAGHVTLDQSKFSDAPAARWFLVTHKTYNFSQRLRRAGVSGDTMHLMIKLF